MKISKIVTAYDARKAKSDWFNAKHPEPEQVERKPLHPAIGILNGKSGKPVYYAYLNGYSLPPVYGTVEELTAQLSA